jgi:hypothetical protein
MKHLKIVGLFVMAAALLMAIAGNATAATFTSPTGTEYTGNFSMSLEGSSLMKAGFAETTCTSSTIAGSWTRNDESHVSGRISSISFSSCGEATIDTINNTGTLTIAKGSHAVSATGVEITKSGLGVSCVYGFGAGISLGTAVDTVVSGSDKVTLAIKANMQLISGGFLCADPAAWTANYIFTTPTTSFVD